MKRYNITIKDGIAKQGDAILNYDTTIDTDTIKVTFGELLYHKDLLQSVELEEIKVAGVTMPDSEGTDRQAELRILQENDSIIWIEPDPSNAYDKTAVKVMSGGKCLGFVPRNLSIKNNMFFNPEKYIVYGYLVAGCGEGINCGLTIRIGQLV